MYFRETEITFSDSVRLYAKVMKVCKNGSAKLYKNWIENSFKRFSD